MKALAVLCLSLLCCVTMGCAAQMAPGDTYTVMIDPAFTADQTESVLSAVQDWTSKIPELTLETTMGVCTGRNARMICIHPSTSAHVQELQKQLGFPEGELLGITNMVGTVGERGDTAGISGVDGGDIYIAMDVVAGDYANGGTYTIPLLQQTVEHEMGHAMGLKHHEGQHLMNSQQGGSCGVATCDDVNQWYYVRYENAPTCNLTCPGN